VCTVDGKSETAIPLYYKFYLKRFSFPPSVENRPKIFDLQYPNNSLYHLKEFSGDTYPFAEIYVHCRWKIEERHSIHYKITLLFIVNFYNQLYIENILSRSYLPADNRISLRFGKAEIIIARILSTDLCAR
jgi:hypothetical protein